jgi:hypothetical protein
MREEFDRKVPALVACGMILLLVLHHFYAMSEHEIYLFALVFLPMILALAVGGLVYPPLMFAIGPRGRDLPLSVKATGALLALFGVACGLFAAIFVYHM